MTSPQEIKRRLRADFLAKLRSLPEDRRRAAGGAITRKFLDDASLSSLSSVGLYWSTPEEVPTHELCAALLKARRSLFLPRVEDEKGRLIFFEVKDLQTLVKGRWGIFEPPATASPSPLTEIQGLVIPGLAFDRRGGRLGRGWGCYDKALGDFSGRKVGLSFDFQVVSELPTESFDRGVDSILTETGWVELNVERS